MISVGRIAAVVLELGLTADSCESDSISFFWADSRAALPSIAADVSAVTSSSTWTQSAVWVAASSAVAGLM